MTYQTSVTSKGQITIPKAFRDKLGLDRIRRVVVRLEKTGKTLQVEAAPDFLEVAARLRPRKNKRMNVLKAREFMEKNYERA